MSQLFATALLVTLGASSASLLTTSNQPIPPQTFQPGTLPSAAIDIAGAAPALSSYLAQANLTASPGDAAPFGDLTEVDQPLSPSPGNHQAIATHVCLSLPNWQRPSEAAQIKQLQTMPNYGEALQSDPLAEIAKTWWGHEFFSFTTYGLSARTDPLYLSGVWTALDNTWDCYSGDQPEQINRGELAEMWLLHHRLVALEWQDGEYLATVEPLGSGLQLVQFPRQESGQGLPLRIVTTTGQALAVMSGDW